MNRKNLVDTIYNRILEEKDLLKKGFNSSGEPFTNSAMIDNLLPDEVCKEINANFPKLTDMKFASNYREQKHVTRSSELIVDLLADITFAFQDDKILELLTEITGVEGLIADKNLYGSGLSSMTQGDFLNPHLDNSHDQNRKDKRVLNLLYYVSPDWQKEYGGNLELWDKKVKIRKEIPSVFNRLVIMETNKTSFHSVNKVISPQRRNCVSNYFFVESKGKDFHISTFKARPGHTIDAIKFGLDTTLRKGLRMFFKNGVFTPDTYSGKEGAHRRKGLKHQLGTFVRDTFLYKDGKEKNKQV